MRCSVCWETTPCLLFKQLFLECLPADIRIQLVDAKIEDCRALAKRADALWECLDAGMESNTVHKPPPTEGKQLIKTSFSTTASLEKLQNSADHHAVGCRETERPVVASGLGSRPY